MAVTTSPPYPATATNGHFTKWFTTAADEVTITVCYVHSDKAADAVFGLQYPIKPEQLRDPYARLMYIAGQHLWQSHEPITIASLSAELRRRASESEKQSQCEAYLTAATYVETELASAKVPEKISQKAKAAALAIKRRANATRLSTATVAGLPDPKFRELAVEDIPTPEAKTEKGDPLYSDHQIAALVYENWGVESLQSHTGQARRIKEYLGADLCFCLGLRWVIYQPSKGHWMMDDKEHSSVTARVACLSNIIRQEAAHLYQLAALLTKAGRESDAQTMARAAAALSKFAKNAESTAFIDLSIKQAQGILKVDREIFDAKPWIIGFKNGVWDKGQWREHRREDYLLYVSPMEIDFNVDRREFYTVLARIVKDDFEFARSIQEFCGYSMSGGSHLRLLFWLYGLGGTGKSTIVVSLSNILGTGEHGLARTVDPEKFSGNGAREKFGSQAYNRFLLACHEAEGKKADAGMMKTVSGGDPLPARFLFKEPFDAQPTHVLAMVSNAAPDLDAYDDPLKDRVVAFPFNHSMMDGGQLHLTGGARIETVRKDLNSPFLKAFAVWALEGLDRVRRTEEFFRAPCLEQSTAKFWQDTDPLTKFWQDIANDETAMQMLNQQGESKGKGYPKAQFRARYEVWRTGEGAEAMGSKTFNKAVESVGIAEKPTNTARYWFISDAKKWAAATKTAPESPENLEEMPESDRSDRMSKFFQQLRKEDLLSRANYQENGEISSLLSLPEDDAAGVDI